MKVFLFLLFSCIISFLQAKSFEEFIRHGEILYAEKKYSESAEAYLNAFNLEEGSALQYYNAACSSNLSGNSDQALVYLNLSADKGWLNLNHLKRDQDLSGLHHFQGWNDVLVKVQANKDEFEKDFDKDLKDQLEKIYIRDQTLRQLYAEAEKKFGKDSEEMNYFWGLVS
jgi:hypothetical protein